MSRFVHSTHRVELGSCACPGTPHAEGDWIELRSSTPWGAIMDADDAESLSERFFIVAVATITKWNLLDDGSDKPVSITAEALDALDGATFAKIMAAVQGAIPKGNALPNASGASSRRLRRGSAASPIPTTPTP